MNKFNKDKYEQAISHLTLMLLVSRMSLSMLLASPESFQGSCWKMTPSPAQLYKLQDGLSPDPPEPRTYTIISGNITITIAHTSTNPSEQTKAIISTPLSIGDGYGEVCVICQQWGEIKFSFLDYPTNSTEGK